MITPTRVFGANTSKANAVPASASGRSGVGERLVIASR